MYCYVTVNIPVPVPDCPSGFVTVTSLVPADASESIVILTVSCVELTKLVELTVIPDPNVTVAHTYKVSAIYVHSIAIAC